MPARARPPLNRPVQHGPLQTNRKRRTHPRGKVAAAARKLTYGIDGRSERRGLGGRWHVGALGHHPKPQRLALRQRVEVRAFEPGDRGESRTGQESSQAPLRIRQQMIAAVDAVLEIAVHRQRVKGGNTDKQDCRPRGAHPRARAGSAADWSRARAHDGESRNRSCRPAAADRAGDDAETAPASRARSRRSPTPRPAADREIFLLRTRSRSPWRRTAARCTGT